MRKLRIPTDRAEDVFSTCIGSLRDTQLRERLESVAPIIAEASQDFNEKAQSCETYTIPAHDNVGGVVGAAEMIAVYEQKLVAKSGPGRSYYDKLLLEPEQGRCPLCGIGFVSTLDHYMPKKQFPALAVTPTNLIPACRDCNLGRKKEFSPKSAEEMLLHPYFDNVDGSVWLQVALSILDNKLVPRYYVSKPGDWSGQLFLRTTWHMNVYNLNSLYAIHAGEEISGRCGLWKKLYQKCGKGILAEQLQDEVYSREKVSLNSWQAALYRALQSQVDLLCRWLDYQEAD